MGSPVEWIHQPGLRREFQFRSESLNGKKAQRKNKVCRIREQEKERVSDVLQREPFLTREAETGISESSVKRSISTTSIPQDGSFSFIRELYCEVKRIGRLSPYKTSGTAKRKANVTAENIQIYLGL